ncbi:hypothetical protein AVEN_42044-1 [Araneus ventricosus]|uniref:Uncharacterized protein n=1 Tax=Araneus ventricosus TaxID=182803 RepID=A0A4Y2GEJ5_ARAVE|nr:hypothetical protein AVEN_42044-1 [Araneus ventricosus]
MNNSQLFTWLVTSFAGPFVPEEYSGSAHAPHPSQDKSSWRSIPRASSNILHPDLPKRSAGIPAYSAHTLGVGAVERLGPLNIPMALQAAED